MAKKLPKPSPETAEKVIASLATKSLDAALASAKSIAKVFGLTTEQAASIVTKAIDAWADAH